MHTNPSRLVSAGRAALLIAASLGAAPALAAEFWLQTGVTTVAGVPMWGYALCGSGSSAPAGCAGPVSVPGPALTVPPGDGLIVHLTNTLPEPTSLVISGQVKQEGMLPVWFEPAAPATTYHTGRPAANTSARVRSFDKEAAAGGGSATYTWAAIKPGTYLYSSGTHPQVQVQMGLYGALIKDAAAGSVAYSQGATNLAYANQATLIYSEVDPALHAAVSTGTYGASGPHSTLEYRPKYFLINGKPFPDASLEPLLTVPAGQSLLLRFLNAGLKTHVPTLHGQHWQVLAEDGNPVPFLDYPRQQYTAFLPAGKTIDVLLTPDNPSTTDTLRYSIVDSRHFDTNNGAPGGGMLVKFDVGPSVTDAGIEIRSLHLSGHGYLLDMRYRVRDKGKAAALLDPKNKVYLVDQARRAQLGVPESPVIGAMRQTARNHVVHTDRDYFILFVNPGRAVRAGDRMQLVVDGRKIAELTVR